MEYIEVTAKTLDEAITSALLKLETTSDNIEYEIIQQPTSGFLGLIGAKPAIIRARRKKTLEELTGIKEEKKQIQQPVHAEKKAERKPEKKPAILEKEDKKEETTEKKKENRNVTPQEFLEQIFKAMNMQVEIEIKEDLENKTLDINLIGDDMGILIGKRGQTLDSLQYLVSLIANKDSQDYIRVKLDTENYRERRKEALETLAKNISYKVKRTKRPVSLEPMNPYERRIIHSALQGDKYVVTRSEGEEPYRHVVISLKRDRYRANNYNGGAKSQQSQQTQQ